MTGAVRGLAIGAVGRAIGRAIVVVGPSAARRVSPGAGAGHRRGALASMSLCRAWRMRNCLAAPPVAREVPVPAPDAAHPEGWGRRGQVADTYVVAVASDGSLILVDQHAAHERLTHEALREQMKNGGVRRQALLSPAVVDLPPADAARLVARADDLARLGLELGGVRAGCGAGAGAAGGAGQRPIPARWCAIWPTSWRRRTRRRRWRRGWTRRSRGWRVTARSAPGGG